MNEINLVAAKTCSAITYNGCLSVISIFFFFVRVLVQQFVGVTLYVLAIYIITDLHSV